MKTNKYIFGLIAMPLLAACSSDEPKPQTDENPRIIAKIVDCEETRVNTEGDGGQFLTGDEIVIDGLGYYGGYTDVNVKYTTKLGTQNGVAEFEFSQGEQLKWNVGTAYVFSYSCPRVSSSYIDVTRNQECFVDYKFNDDQSSVEKLRESDLLMAYKYFNYDSTVAVGKDVNLEMSHYLNKITITIDEYSNFGELNCATDIPSNVKINSCFYENIDELPVYYFVSGTNVFKTDSSLTESCLRAISPYAQLDPESGKHSFTAIVMPIAYKEGDVLMTFKFKGIEYIVKSTGDICTDAFAKMGQHYHFTVKLNGKNPVNVSSITLEDWSYYSKTTLQDNRL